MTPRRVARWVGIALLGVAITGALIWLFRALDLTAQHLTAIWVTVTCLWLLGLSVDRFDLFDRIDEATDAADRALTRADDAHERIDKVIDRQHQAHDLARRAALAAEALYEQFRDHRHPIDAATDPIGMRTVERPAIDLAAGLRAGNTASGYGKHAARDTGIHDLPQAGAQ